MRTPPEALTPTSGPTTARIRRTSSTVAPPPPKPVEVLTKAAPAARAMAQPAIFSSRVSIAVSRMTLTGRPCAASTTARMSSKTASWSPPLSQPMLITMSISRAPSAMACRVSAALASVAIAPRGKPTTQIGLTGLPSSMRATRRIQVEFTHTLAKRYFRASSQTRTMSARVAVGLSSVWSM